MKDFQAPDQTKIDNLANHAFAMNLKGKGIEVPQNVQDWGKEYDRLRPNRAGLKGVWYDKSSYRISEYGAVHKWQKSHIGDYIQNEGHLKIEHKEPNGTITELKAIASEDGRRICFNIRQGMHSDGGFGLELPEKEQFNRQIEVSLEEAKSIVDQVTLTREGQDTNIKDVVAPYLERSVEQPPLKEKLAVVPERAPIMIKLNDGLAGLLDKVKSQRLKQGGAAGPA